MYPCKKTTTRDVESMNNFSLLILLTFGVLSMGCIEPISGENKQKVVVDRVIDGDTFEVTTNHHNITVRIKGVDAPEIFSENNPEDWENCEINETKLREAGYNSTEFFKENYENQTAYFEEVRRDYYGRTVGFLYTDNYSEERQFTFGEILLNEGYGMVPEQSRFEKRPDYEEIVEEAREENKGLWSYC